MKLPQDKDSDKLPNGMSIKEYLLSTPSIDFEKFRNQNERMRQINSFRNQRPESEIEENISQLKNEEPIYENQNYDDEVHGNLTDVAPDDITNEAEDIIKSVFEQEKIEREENDIYHSTDNYYNSEPANEVDDNEEYHSEPESASSVKRFIDFGDLDESKEEKNEVIEEPKVENNDRSFLRERREMPSERIQPTSFQNNENPREELLRNRSLDEMTKRREFVEVKAEKKEEKIKPYRYKKPPFDLITTTSDDLSMFNNEVPTKRVALENALANFGVPAKVINVVIGPTVTRYELQMPEGISVKKVLTLDADIAYALSATGIRIEAPVPGRNVVGIEVPNGKIAKVSIKDILTSKEFTMSPSPLVFALGKDINNTVRICNLQKMPHLLVAGTTGSGKSVCLNSIIVSLLYRSSPEDLKFIMIDPKQVELSMYEGLPHMVVPKVIKEPEKAVNALAWAVDEMERRFNLISEVGVRNIEEYNKTEKVVQRLVKKMPYIVIIFDEFADFMAVAKNEIEDKVRRLAGKARAAGIHLILATQRPSTDVVTGTLKGNLPARIAFKVAGRIDSEVILGATGAEKLLGYGDMLYKPDGSNMSRIQGCFIDTPETKEIVKYIVDNNEEIIDEEAFNAIYNPGKATGNGNGEGGKDSVDELMPRALKICIDNGFASITMLQRKLAIGFSRAGKIIDQMEERGYISSANGSKPRTVYTTIEEFYAIFGDIYD